MTNIQPWSSGAEDSDLPPVDLRMDVPHPARMYDYFLGGKDNFEADRVAADKAAAAFPGVRIATRANRRFLSRVVRHLVGEAGIDQLLDIGTGIPTAGNTHTVAQSCNPAARVVYLDNDPIVMAHSRALLTGTPEGRTAFLEADLRDPAAILESAELRDTLDLDRPVALMLMGVLHFVTDDDRPREIVDQLMDALPAGSYLAISHTTADLAPEQWRKFSEVTRAQGLVSQQRSLAEVSTFFEGLELVEPGVGPVHLWHPDDDGKSEGTPEERMLASLYGGVARKA